MPLTITIEGDLVYGPSWVALEALLQTVLNDGEGRLTRIRRRDGGANYRDPSASYDCYFTLKGGFDVQVALIVRKGGTK